MKENYGNLFLIPTTLGDNEPLEVLPISVKQIVERVNIFIVENEKTTRRFIKKITPRKSQPDLNIFILDKFTSELESKSYLDACLDGQHVGLLSEAGVPAIADPGASIVMQAHQKNIKVIPLVGPSSIVLAMMSSGLNGQNFAFNGYLPIDKNERKRALKDLEKTSKLKNQSQVFIETPYRNDKLFIDLKNNLTSSTFLCVAVDITLTSEFIKTMNINDWKRQKIDLHKRPCIFIIHKF